MASRGPLALMEDVHPVLVAPQRIDGQVGTREIGGKAGSVERIGPHSIDHVLETDRNGRGARVEVRMAGAAGRVLVVTAVIEERARGRLRLARVVERLDTC